MTFSLDWKYGWTTRGGQKVRFLWQVKRTDYPLVFVVDHGEYEEVTTHKSDGRYYQGDSGNDIINAPAPTVTRTKWVVTLPSGGQCIWDVREHAEAFAARSEKPLIVNEIELEFPVTP